MAQLGFDGMPTRLFSCTPSRLTTWLDCPRRYRMTYVDRPPPPKGPPWAHNSVGASAHNALREWWMQPADRRTPEAAATLTDRQFIREGFRDDAQAEEWRERTRAMVSAYVATHVDPTSEPVGVERTVATRTDSLAISGRVDRIDERGDEVVVVDYKTGRRPLGVDDARGSLALALYAAAAQRSLRRRCTRVELHHLPTGEVHAWDHTEETLARQLRRAEGIGAEAAAAHERVAVGEPVADELFPPRPGPACGWCDFARHCPEGRAAGPRREPWDGLAG